MSRLYPTRQIVCVCVCSYVVVVEKRLDSLAMNSLIQDPRSAFDYDYGNPFSCAYRADLSNSVRERKSPSMEECCYCSRLLKQTCSLLDRRRSLSLFVCSVCDGL